MALFQMVSEKMYQGERWSNRYILEGAELADVMPAAAQIRVIEQGVHMNYVTFTKYRVSDQVEDTDVYEVVDDNVVGLDLPPTGGEATLPLFVRVRCLFNTNGGGRPSVKYLCPPVVEGYQNFGILTTAAKDFYQDSYVDLLVDIAEFVDVDGQTFKGGSVASKLGMRQMRHGTRRKATPIIP